MYGPGPADGFVAKVVFVTVEVLALGGSVPVTGDVRVLAKEDAVGAVSGDRGVLGVVAVEEFIRRPEAGAEEEVVLVMGDAKVVFGLAFWVRSGVPVFACDDVLTTDPPVFWGLRTRTDGTVPVGGCDAPLTDPVEGVGRVEEAGLGVAGVLVGGPALFVATDDTGRTRAGTAAFFGTASLSTDSGTASTMSSALSF